MADTVPAMLEPGEYVIRKDAVDKIGVENLDMMNNIDRSSQMYMSHGGLVPQLQNAHSAIDELLALNTLANQDNVDMTRESSIINFQDSQLLPDAMRTPEKDILGDILNQNSNNKSSYSTFAEEFPKLNRMMKQSDLEYIIDQMKKEKPLLEQLKDVGSSYKEMLKSFSPFNKGGQLKPIPKDNKGLGKLPATVRNRMGYMQEGGKVPKDPDPLQIDARMRGKFKDVGTIGVVNPKRNMMSELSKLQKDISTIKFLRERFKDNPENMRAQIRVRELPNMEDIMEILNEASKMTKPKSDTIRGYQNGGQAFSFGSQTTETPMLEDIYRMAGLRPIAEQARNFQEYDASREQGALADYSRGVQNLRSQGTGALGQASLRAQNMGGGFAGFGGRQASQDALRRQAGMQYQSGLEQAGQRRFETIRGMREQFIGDTIAQLGQLEGAEGTQTVRQPAREVSQLPTTDEGDVTYNGTRYVFYQGQYITESEFDNIMEEEQDRSGDRDDYFD